MLKFDKKNTLIYLAIPYTGSEAVSFEIANKVAGVLMQRGVIIFSPISHSHSIAEMCALPVEWHFWEYQDRLFIERSEELWVICCEGWERSKGVKAEIDYANELGKRVRFLAVDDKGDHMEITDRAGQDFETIQIEID